MKLLVISNSTNAGEAYLDYPKVQIRDFLGAKPVNALFIPYAGIMFSYDDYEKKVENRFSEIGHHVTGIHRFDDPVKAVEEAEAICPTGNRADDKTRYGVRIYYGIVGIPTDANRFRLTA